MDSAKAEQVILARFKERCHTAGAIQAGYGMRAQAIRVVLPAGTDVDGPLKGMVEKGSLNANPARPSYYLPVDGAARITAA